jgi:hypothetical protein
MAEVIRFSTDMSPIQNSGHANVQYRNREMSVVSPCDQHEFRKVNSDFDGVNQWPYLRKLNAYEVDLEEKEVRFGPGSFQA